ncbi:MAG: rRNA cytosine-C5-methyltransferase [Bacteroidales bacterium]|nr:rRNA cytosine-C5-methyltransferase [Bacteroidales bacterium]
MEVFRTYLAEAVGQDRADRVLEALSEAAPVAVRLHPGKPGADFPGAAPVPWNPLGRVLTQRPSFTLDPLLHAGAYYVQDSSAQFVGQVARGYIAAGPRPLRVLDLCAAPGGKTTDLAASLRAVCGDRFLLVANEVMRQRATVLADNVGRWGDPCVFVTSVDPAAFAALPGYFDLIVADVPCSGEGMFRKDPEALRQWSPENVSLCAARQRRIVADVWDALAPQGILVYSTCTFNRYENDGNVRWIADTLGAEVLPLSADFPGLVATQCGVSLLPGFVPGEGQYCAALRKGEGKAWKAPREARRPAVASPAWTLFDRPVKVLQRSDIFVAVPEVIAAEAAVLESLRPLSMGTAVGTYKGKDLVPHADLALSLALRKDAFPAVGVDRETALRFLHRDTVTLQAPKGLVLLTYGELTLGFVKNLGTRCNNLLPQHRRIRMDVV